MSKGESDAKSAVIDPAGAVTPSEEGLLKGLASLARTIAYRHYGLNPTELDDCVQDVLLAFLDTRKTVRDSKAWVAQATRFMCCKTLRKKIGRREVEKNGVNMEALSFDANMDEKTEQVLRWGRFTEAYHQLKIECQRIIRALFVDELSHRELSKVLQLSPGSVHKKKEICFKTMRALFKKGLKDSNGGPRGR